MKKLTRPAIYFALGTLLITQSGCFGGFALTTKLYDWNDGVSSSKFVKSLLFWGLCIIPVYEIAVMIDVVILNLIEFWSGSNPVSMQEGEYEMQLATVDGVDYRIEATKDTFTTTQLSGEKAGEVRVMKFDRADMTWKYTDSRVSQQAVMSLVDGADGTMRFHTANGTMDIPAADVYATDVVMAKLGDRTSGALVSAN